MTKMKDKFRTKKNVIVLDFDHTIYDNIFQDYSINIRLDSIIHASCFFSQLSEQIELFSRFDFAHSTQFFLISGRSDTQKPVILDMLKLKGYHIDRAYLCNHDMFRKPHAFVDFDENLFRIRYWADKVSLICRLNSSQKYNSITVISSSDVVCTMLKELGFTVIKTEISDFGIDFTPYNQQSNLHLIEEEILVHG